RSMSFGAIGRNFLARYPLAGTYDQNWQDNVFPFLPADFNPAYFQAAPQDQQVDKIAGGEPVILLNLTPDGRRDFQLPEIDVPVVFVSRKGDRAEMKATVDTVAVDGEAGQLTMVWRTSLPLQRNIFEVKQVVAG